MHDSVTLDLFAAPPASSAPPRATGRQLRDRGIDRAVAHAERVEPEWKDRAYAYLRRHMLPGVNFTCEDVRIAAQGDKFPAPPDDRAWGGIVMRAARAGLIRRVGYTSGRLAACHCGPKALWTLA